MKARYYNIPIMNSEYHVRVYIGSIKSAVTLAREKYKWVKNLTIEEFEGCRGKAFNTLPDGHVFVVIDGDMEPHEIMGTLAHEASHAVDYIMCFTSITDDEFRGHSVGAIVREVMQHEWKRLEKRKK